MIEKTLVIKSESGLHARPAGVFAKKAAQYKSNITIRAPKGTANGKSIMSIMTLGIDKGAEVTLAADGADEAQALQDLSQLLEV